MSRLDRRKFGFWYAIFEYKKIRLFGLEGLVALGVGTDGSIELAKLTTAAQRVAIAGDFLTFVSALLGVVLAGFALVVAFLSDTYTLQLQKSPKGVRAFFAPFIINIGLDVGFVVGAVAYRAAAPFLSAGWEKSLFIILSTVFVYATLNVTALARTIMAHGVTRAELLSLEQEEEKQQEEKLNGSGRKRKWARWSRRIT
jgi:small-conductance mechanosensitive channel